MKKTLVEGLVHQTPADLPQALKNKNAVKRLWKNLTPIARNEFICWIEDAKQAKLARCILTEQSKI